MTTMMMITEDGDTFDATTTATATNETTVEFAKDQDINDVSNGTGLSGTSSPNESSNRSPNRFEMSESPRNGNGCDANDDRTMNRSKSREFTRKKSNVEDNPFENPFASFDILRIRMRMMTVVVIWESVIVIIAHKIAVKMIIIMVKR